MGKELKDEILNGIREHVKLDGIKSIELDQDGKYLYIAFEDSNSNPGQHLTARCEMTCLVEEYNSGGMDSVVRIVNDAMSFTLGRIGDGKFDFDFNKAVLDWRNRSYMSIVSSEYIERKGHKDMHTLLYDLDSIPDAKTIVRVRLNDVASVTFNESMLDALGTTKEDVFIETFSRENDPDLYKICSVAELIGSHIDLGLYVITNDTCSGASVILHLGVLERKFAEKNLMDKRLFIIPSSTNEVLVADMDMLYDADAVLEIIKSVNSDKSLFQDTESVANVLFTWDAENGLKRIR